MADIEQTVRIKSDTTGLKDIDAANKRAFSPASMREYKREGKELEREHVQLNRRIVELTRSMRGLDQGTKAFKAMRKELKGVAQEARLVKTAMESIDRAASRPGGGSFIAGLAQGTGLAQYMPTGPGMRARMVGAGVGGMFRRAASGAAAPFLQPGMGGMTQMLGAIPVVGGVAGGALQSAAGYYQEAVAFQRQQLQNAYFANGSLGRRVGPSMEAVASFEASQAATEAAKSGVIDRVLGAGGTGPGGTPRLSDPARMLLEGVKAGAGSAYERVADFIAPARKVVGQAGKDELERRAVQHLTLGMIKGKTIPQAIGGTFEAAHEYQRLLGQSEGRRPPGSSVLSGLGSHGFGIRLGFGMPEQAQMRGAFFGASGQLFDQGQFNEAMVAQRRFGVGAETAGGFSRMMAAGGGGTGQMSLAAVLGAAESQGLKGSRIVEYLQELVGLGKDAERRGIKINAEEFAKSTAVLSAAGIAPGRQGMMTAGMQGQAQRVAEAGVQNPMDMLIMRAAGWTPEQGAEGYYRVSNMLASKGLSAEGMGRLIGMVATGAGGAGSEEGKVFHTRRALGMLKANATPEEARLLAQGITPSGELTPEAQERLNLIKARGEKMGDVGAQAKEALRRTGILGPAVQTEAGLQAQRIGVGGGFAGLMKDMQQASINSVKILGNFGSALEALTTLVVKATKAIDIATGSNPGNTGGGK